MAVTRDGGGSATVSTGGVGLQGKFNGGNIQEYINPPADSRLNSILHKTGSPLRQGIIQQTDDMVTGPQKYPYACRFMFNPTTLDVGYATDESVFDPSKLTPDQAAAVALVPGKTSLSFSLLFDRTYEVAYGPSGSVPRDLRNIGVYADIAALENVVGARYNFATKADAVIQPMGIRPCYFVFGGGAGNVGLTFIGAIVQMQVTYSSFSERMVPVRAGVQLQVVQFLGRDFNQLNERGGTLIQRAADRRGTNGRAPAGGR